MKRAIGSSYCIDQSPGAERVGGLTIRLMQRVGEVGTLSVSPIDRLTGKTLDEDTVRDLTAAAVTGLQAAAAENAANLNDFDVVLSDFAYHPVDSSNNLYRGAAMSAFQSAWRAWNRF